MLSVKIPFVESLDSKDFEQNVHFLRKYGAKLLINNNSWKDKYPYIPTVEAYMGYDSEGIMILYDVQCTGLRTMALSDGNYVHEDSCVEFFMQKERGESYINIEFNAFGICYASRHSSRKESTPLQKEEYDSIKRYTTVKEQGLNDNGEHSWTLAFKVSWHLLGYAQNEIPDLFYANLYKCGDKTSMPHFLSWNKIEGYDNPAFHCPENFGVIEMIK